MVWCVCSRQHDEDGARLVHGELVEAPDPGPRLLLLLLAGAAIVWMQRLLLRDVLQNLVQLNCHLSQRLAARWLRVLKNFEGCFVYTASHEIIFVTWFLLSAFCTFRFSFPLLYLASVIWRKM